VPPTLLSEEWLAACNEALARCAAPPDGAAPLVVTEVITGAPDGIVGAVTLVADPDGVRLVAGGRDDATAWLTMSMDDAVALHEGRIDPAGALTAGRVKVRGDLGAVTAASALLAAAHAAMRAR